MTTVALQEMEIADDAPIIGMIDKMIARAIQGRASDIHVEPTETALRVRFRIDGILREFAVYPLKIRAALISRLKIMGALDIAEKRLPQDGRISYMDDGKEFDLRISTLPTIFGEKIVLRILDRSAMIADINQLGLADAALQSFRRLCQQPYGMILVTGPTSSGKSTTLYAALAELNTAHENIVTIEDPVEYRLPGINQVQVNPKAGLTFASGLRSILRQDPNVIMIGEIRDSETANIAVRAALTGHLVLTTLHTNNATGAISRLMDMGVEPFLIASSLLGVLAQRLVRVICPHCQTSCVTSAQSAKREGRGSGCAECGGTGYCGRIAIHEVLELTKPMKALISRRESTDGLRAAALAAGMQTMYDDGVQKVLQGRTTMEEVRRVVYVDE